MTPTNDQVRAAVARQAAEWFLANQDPAPEYADRAEFVAWLKASLVHVKEYLGVALVARDLRVVADVAEGSLESLLELARADASGSVVPGPVFQRHERPSQRLALPRRWAFAGAALAATVVMAIAVLWRTADDGSTTLARAYRTDDSEQMLQQLPDGSAVHLNNATALAVRYDRDERVVRIENGQALFTVAHDDPRRFRVVAGMTEIVAVGTRFDVRRDGESTEVIVVEGRVDVRPDGAYKRNAPDAAPLVRRVNAGYGLRIDGGVMPAQSERVDVHVAVAWLQHRIAIERRPLGEVADELNHYGFIELGIDDQALRSMPISGVFNAYDTDSFAAFLETLDGVRVERMPTRIRVVKEAHTNPGDTPAVR